MHEALLGGVIVKPINISALLTNAALVLATMGVSITALLFMPLLLRSIQPPQGHLDLRLEEPKTSDDHVMKANDLIRAASIQDHALQALKHCNLALHKNATNPEAHICLATVLPYISATKKDAAKKHLQIAITLLKKNGETRKAEYLEPLFTQTIEQTSEFPVTVLNSKP